MGNILNISTGLNMVASFFLICALIPAYLDARREQKTFFLEESFFKFFFYGASLMWVNSAIFFIKDAVDTAKWKEATIYMFIGFLISNSVSMFVNHYSWMTKRRNMRESAKLGISEQQYWETVVAPNLKVNNK